MGKVRKYLVSFSPAERTANGFRVAITVGVGARGASVVEAGDFATLEREVRRLAAEYGQTCSPYIRLEGRGQRNAPGFEQWAKSIQVIDAVAAKLNSEAEASP
jgi:hypothetical protein